MQHLTIARVADGLGVAWNTANDAVPAKGWIERSVGVEARERHLPTSVTGRDDPAVGLHSDRVGD